MGMFLWRAVGEGGGLRILETGLVMEGEGGEVFDV